MKQTTKFYLTSFLKNQTYFTPILVVFLQAMHLSFQEIFLLFTLGSVFSLIIEIPTGVIADLWGKRRSIIISKFVIFLAYLMFGFCHTFWHFVIAQLLLELGNSFRTGTETAYTFDYLKQNKGRCPSYTEVKSKQKIYARIGEAIAAAIGGVIAARYGFHRVFFIAAIPAFANFLVCLSWEKIQELESTANLRQSLHFARQSLQDICGNRQLLNITLNITMFSAVLAALSKYIQPYMSDAAIPVEYFGYIYTASMLITVIALYFADRIENKFGTIATINWISILAVIPVLIIGLRYVSIAGVMLFFLVIIAENIRSPIANGLFHQQVNSERRATLGSIESLAKSLGKIIILPIAGYFAETFSFYTSILVLGAILLFSAIIFRIRPETPLENAPN